MFELIENNNMVFNLGSGEDNSINEFAEKVCKAYGYDSALIKHDLTKYVGVKAKKIDTEKVIKYLDGKTFLKTSLTDGIKNCVNYFIKNYE